MAPVLRALCIEHLCQQSTEQIQAIYAVYQDELEALAKNALYSPTEMISVLGHALGLSIECINLESARELVEAVPDANINFKIYLDPKTSNHGVNAHYFVHPDDENSTFADGNCLYHAVAQCLKMQYMHEKWIQNTYYDKLFKYTVMLDGTGYSFTQPQVLMQRTAFFKPQEIDMMANVLMTGALAGICITLSGLLALSIPLWMSISASLLMLGLGIKLANYENIGHASLMNP
jgi:hypothetical protein